MHLLCFHGLMGSPQEFDPLRSLLTAEGVTVHTHTLPAHAHRRHAQGLHQVRFGLLRAEAQAALEALLSQQPGEPVILLGHSLGALLALQLAASVTHPALCGVVSLAAPIQESYLLKRWRYLDLPMGFLVRGVRHLPDAWTGLPRPRPLMPWHWRHLSQEAEVAMASLREHLPQMRLPLLAAHAAYDLTVPVSEIDALLALVGTPEADRHILRLPAGGHLQGRVHHRATGRWCRAGELKATPWA
jgi:alpha-beta hydrolase superfamily lysophospholipase